ncbi:Nodule Cysteine-Rich (NCR) secreted peptide [Medicago truncatula]|uniref:Nodule Cysteine-Rich (NCR) secreted peptide n=1 Tax=Medicago truncatula TaxID=3880 RepID=G7KEA2_MEDTR|nr:Nodule Cysteine-Rich (NCR) secreted peptide [Medicago truncatula]
MNKILKFVYEMILFLSLFHLAREVHDVAHTDIPCEPDADCPKSLHEYFEMKCIDKKCEWSRKTSLIP